MTFFKPQIIVLLVLAFATTTKAQYDLLVYGHLYPYVKDESNFDKLFEVIKKENNHLYVDLGDETKTWYEKSLIVFGDDLLFAPGNHDRYIKYNYPSVKIKKYKHWWLMTINSSDSLESINEALSEIKQAYENEPCLIFSHHRIWNDSLLSNKSYSHDKSYLADDLQLNEFNVKGIFAGNSCLQYMLDNSYYVSWVDWWKGVPCYNIGTCHSPQEGASIAKVKLSEEDFFVQFEKIEMRIEKKDAKLKAMSVIVLRDKSYSKKGIVFSLMMILLACSAVIIVRKN